MKSRLLWRIVQKYFDHRAIPVSIPRPQQVFHLTAVIEKTEIAVSGPRQSPRLRYTG